MNVYFACYAILALAFIVGVIFNRLRLAALAAFIPMLVIIIARGTVGTDSSYYIQDFDRIYLNGFLASGFEPGFALLVEFLGSMCQTSFDVLILLGGITAIIMLFAGLSLERTPILFITIILPYFMIDMTINGLRFGLAFALVALGTAGLVRGRLLFFVFCGFAAASIQVTSVLLSVGLWALLEVRLKTFFAVAMSSFLTIQLFGDRFEDKIIDNSEIFGLGGFSGTAPLFATVIVIIGLQFPKEKVLKTQLSLLAILGMQIASFLISRYYYAGLRLQGLCFFLLYLFVASSIRRAAFDFNKDRLLKGSLATAMIISGASRLKNFEDDISGPSPFNPYYISERYIFRS